MSLDPSQAAVIPVTGIKLINRETWPDWYSQLRYHARFRGIWKYVDPNAEDAPHLPSAIPSDLSTATEDSGEGAPPESSTAPSDRKLGIKEWSVLSSRYTSLWNWINETVDRGILSSVLRELDLLHPDDDPSIQRIVRVLKEQFAPSDESTANTVRIEYIAALNEASNLPPSKWYPKWHDAYVRARAHNIPEVQGRLAIQQFLLAIAKRMDPEWAQRELSELARAEALGTPVMPLEQYGKWFSTLIYQREQFKLGGAHGAFSTLDGRSESPPGSEGYRCPCLANKMKHRWPPEKCYKLLRVFGKALPPGASLPELNENALKRIKCRALLNEWKAIREQVEALPDASMYGNIMC